MKIVREIKMVNKFYIVIISRIVVPETIINKKQQNLCFNSEQLDLHIVTQAQSMY